MNVLVLDAGNAIIKAKTAGREVTFAHALHELSETEYQNILTRSGRGGAPIDYIRINGTPYVTGESAERFGVLTRRTGSARYAKDYYGAFVAAALARIYERGGEVGLFGSHPPGDIEYRDDLLEAALGQWDIEAAGQALKFRISLANSFDEPAGGLFNVILAPDGQHYARSDINGGRALVIDIGGHTTDLLAVNAGGAVDYSLHVSEAVGILEALQDFQTNFRAAHKEDLKGVDALPVERVRQALRTGQIKIAGRTYDCEREALQAVTRLINRIRDVYQRRAMNGADFDTVILTGGGSGLLYERLTPVLAHDRVILADDPADLHLANVRGGLKLWRLMEANDLI